MKFNARASINLIAKLRPKIKDFKIWLTMRANKVYKIPRSEKAFSHTAGPEGEGCAKVA